MSTSRALPHSTASLWIAFGSLSLLSAFLLFQVQPIISKFILPWYGGSPGVWTTCMLFFQLVLFAGYAYAHGLTRLPARAQWLVHGALVLACLVFLPVTPSTEWKPEGGADPVKGILLLLLATVGLPYFILSSTSPLVQVWFNRASGGASPWRLYALSNLGSLAALLSYPFFFEVRWDVTGQTRLWSAGFALFALLTLWMLWRDRAARRGAEAPNSDVAQEVTAAPPPPSAARRLAWLLLPALASVLLLATTNHVCQDVAVIPFLWVVPLSLYLLTFIICFEHERWYKPLLWAPLAAAACLLASVYPAMDWDRLPLDLTYKTELGICFSAMFLGAMVCHGELTRLKPEPGRLTDFYLFLSAGGALGGLLVTLVAPRVFVIFMEWYLGLAAVFVVALLALTRQLAGWRFKWIGRPLAVCALAALPAGLWWMLVNQEIEPRLARVRNFYGVISVSEEFTYDDYDGYSGGRRSLYHGEIMHGMQRTDPAERGNAFSYYGRRSGAGRTLARLRQKSDARIGLVGMGAGAALVYGVKGQTWRVYEINPAIPGIARGYFTFIDDFIARGGNYVEVIGDGRLSLEREVSQRFDALLLDAFSGDSVPMHLLTREAFEIYERHLAPNGVIVVNCTNRYVTLAPVVRKIAENLGFGVTRIYTEWSGDDEITDYVLVTRDKDFLAANPDSPEDVWDDDLPVELWTDQRHNLFEVLEKF
jgi:hypothetical protein